MKKNILYVGFKYDYGRKERGLGLNYKGWFEGFRDLGFSLTGLFYEDFSKERFQVELMSVAEETRPDLIFFILQKSQVDVETIVSLKEKGFFVVNFFGDDQWRFERWSSKYAPYFSACITTDKYSVDKYIKLGQRNIVRSQWASLESFESYENVAYKYDVSFVGGVSPYRQWFVKALAKKGIKVHCFGSGWDNGRVSYDEMHQIFLSSKINLNISNSANFDVRYVFSSVRVMATTTMGVPKDVSQTKARNFEIPVQGGFQLTEYVPSIEDYFDLSSEIACYKDVDEAVLLIDYYLTNEDERERKKNAGVSRARAQHTFKCRIKEFMAELKEICEIDDQI